MNFSLDVVIGRRPKLLRAVLDMLIAEHAARGGGRAYARTPASEQKEQPPERSRDGAVAVAVLGGATNLACPLVADVLLAFGPLPRAYEALGILARLLDSAVQAAHLSDEALAQAQGCLRAIFRPAPAEAAPAVSTPTRDRAEGTKIKLSLKTAKPASSMFPDLPADDSAYERKLLQRVLKKAIASMKENDPQVRCPGSSFSAVLPCIMSCASPPWTGLTDMSDFLQSLFLNPVTDAIAPGLFLIKAIDSTCSLRSE